MDSLISICYPHIICLPPLWQIYKNIKNPDYNHMYILSPLLRFPIFWFLFWKFSIFPLLKKGSSNLLSQKGTSGQSLFKKRQFWVYTIENKNIKNKQFIPDRLIDLVSKCLLNCDGQNHNSGWEIPLQRYLYVSPETVDVLW
jgi:hypothetical protein